MATKCFFFFFLRDKIWSGWWHGKDPVNLTGYQASFSLLIFTTKDSILPCCSNPPSAWAFYCHCRASFSTMIKKNYANLIKIRFCCWTVVFYSLLLPFFFSVWFSFQRKKYFVKICSLYNFIEPANIYDFFIIAMAFNWHKLLAT